jgi:site-specific DNA-cytosine methylase
MEDLNLLTSDSLQRALGVSRSTLWRLRRQGMPSRRLGRGIRYPLAEVRAWLDALASGPSQLELTFVETRTPASPSPAFPKPRRRGAPGSTDELSSSSGRHDTPWSELPRCHWRPSVALDPKHKPQQAQAPSTTVRKDWRKYPQEAHLLDSAAGRFRRLTADEIAVLQGFPATWASNLGLSNRERIAGLGNAVPPPVGRALYQSINRTLDRDCRAAVEICAGFGGLALGAHQATGVDLLALVEFWEAAVRVLRASPQWPSSRVHFGDVKAFPWDSLAGQVDVLSGGPPCQPWSTAGHSRGSADERDLLGEMSGIVQTLRPRAFIFENVPGLLRPAHRGYLKRLVEQLRSAGSYGVAVGVIQAADFGVPQRRKRVVIAGFRDRPDSIAHAFFDHLAAHRTHADPSRVLPSTRKPWVTIEEAIPDWRARCGWRQWLEAPKETVDLIPSNEVSDADAKASAPNRQALSMGLVWPGRDLSVDWTGAAWTVTARLDSDNREIAPLLRKGSSGRPQQDPWYLHGNHVRSLEALRAAIGRRAKLVYFEPARLDTDLVSFAAEDARSRLNTWLSLCQATIRRASSLVRDDGVIAVLTGVSEQPYLQVLMDEIFGPENRVGTVVWQKGYSVQGQRKDKPKKEIYPTHDYVLVYGRRAQECLSGVALKAPPKNFSNDDGDPRGPWKAEQKGANYHRASSDFSVNLPPYRWEVVGGTPPPWFWRVSPKSGVIWAPADEIQLPGKWNFKVRVTDSRGGSDERELTLEVVPNGNAPIPAPPSWLIARDADGCLTNAERAANAPKQSARVRIVTESLPTATIGRPYYACLEADGGAPLLGTTRPGKNSVSGKSRYWDLSYETLELAAAEDAIDFKATDQSIPAVKVYLDGASFTYLNQISTWRGDGSGKRGNKNDPLRVGWGQDAKQELEGLLAAGTISKVVNISKPLGLMTRLMALFTEEFDFVVDIGSPAAEMASVCCQLRRHAVYVEMPGTESDRDTIRVPRLRSAAKGAHPVPPGVLFFADSGAPPEEGFYVGRRARAADSAADVCEFFVGSPFVRVSSESRAARIDYSEFESGGSSFHQALASSEGLVWVPTGGSEFAQSLDGNLIAVHLPGTQVLDGRSFLQLRSHYANHLSSPERRLRIYYHRGFGDVKSALDGQVELRHLPFDLLLAAGG